MFSRFKLRRKIFAWFSIASLLIQALSGILLYQPVYSEELTPTPTPIIEATPTLEPTPEVSPTPDPEVTPTSVEEITPTPALEPSPTPIVEPSPTLPPPAQVEENNQDSSQSTVENPTETLSETDSSPPTPTPTVSVESPKGSLSATILHDVSAQSLDLNLDSQDQTNSAALVTDKTDYAPTDSVLITGASFVANQTYALIISSENEPPVHFETQVTANEDGNFAYAYQLDGNYRPNYKVEAKDSSGNIVVTITFTDTPAPSNTKLNQWETIPSGNWITGALNSSNSNYSEGETVPFELNLGTIAVSDNPYTFSICRDYQNGTHFGYISLQPYNTSRSAVPDGSISTTNPPFSGSNISSINFTEVGGQGACSSGQRETQLSINVTSGSADTYLLWGGRLASPIDPGVGTGNGASSYPGGSLHMHLLFPNKDVGIQTSAIIPQPTGSIILDKITNPSQDPTLFSFSTTGLSVPTSPSLTDASTPVTWSALSANIYTITETPVAGWTLSSKNCTGGTSSVVTPITNGVSISLAAGENLTCTFTNTLQQAHLNVIKHVINDNGGTAIASNFTMAVSGINVSSPSFPGAESPGTDVTLDAGLYNVTESGPTGYSANYSADCTGTIAAGQTKTCTITNDDIAPTLRLVKEVTNDDGGQANPVDWTLNARTLCVFGDTSLACGFSDNGDSTTFHPLAAGKVYNLWESGPSGYTMGSWSCNGGSLNGNRLTLGLDEEVTCTITNDDQPGSISGMKFEDKNGNGVKDAEDSGLSSWTINLSGPVNTSIATDSNGSYTFPSLPAGTYTVTESLELGWTQTTVNPGPINLANGQSVDEINFGNFELGSVSGEKFEDLDGDELAQEEGEPLLSGWTIRLYDITTTPWALVDTDVTDDSGEYSFTNLEPGNYRACEVLQSGWTQLFPNINNNNNSPSSFEEGPRCQTVNIDNSGESNTRNFGNFKRGLITIIKNTIGGDDTFIYDVMPTEEIFQIQTVGNTGDKVFGDLSAGEYVVTERELVGWDLTGLTCSAGGAVDIGNKMATITITSGADVTCTFTNTQRGTISGTKYEVNSDSSIVNVLSDWIVYLFSGDIPIGQTSTDPSGNFFFGNLVPGTYSLLEDLLGGWTPIFAPSEVNLNPGDSSTDNNFGNFQNGSIEGVKFNDLNGNGEMDCDDDSNGFCEFGLEEWVIFLYANENGILNGGGQSQETDEDGYYSFTNLEPGSYTVCEEEQAGWQRTKPAESNCETVEINTSGQVSTVDFGNQGRGTITVHKNVDGNGDGDLEDEGVDIINSTDWVWDIGEDGFATGDESQGVAAGLYTISEHQQDNYHVTSVECNNKEEYDPSESIEAEVEPGQDLVCTFTNTRNTGIIEVHKRVDDGSGTYQLGDSEANDLGFRWTLDNGVEQTMGSSTSATTGDKHDINENTISGYVFTGWYETWEEIFSCENPESTSLPVSLTVTQGQRRSITLCNQLQNPVLTLTKSNNAAGDKSPGDNLLFTLTIEATQSAVNNVQVIDLPPGGFKYRAGSWTASSNLNPGLVVSEPVYASPGVWNLGDMQMGEIITLKYIADIDTSQQPGLYKDLAWAQGTSVLANNDTGIFVGTEVNVVKEQQSSVSYGVEKEEQREGQVLGAAALPATGANTWWLVMALILLGVGLNSLALGTFLKKRDA